MVPSLLDLKWRIAAGFCSLLVAAVIFFFSSYRWVVSGGIGLVAVVALWEYHRLVQKKGLSLSFPLIAGLGAAQVVSFLGPASASAVLLFASLILLFLWHFRWSAGAIAELSAAFFGLLYIAVPLGMLVAIFYLNCDGVLWVAYLIAVVKGSDTGAYFGGRLFGRRALAAAISPRKTIEGACAGLLLAFGLSLLFIHWISAPLWLGVLLAIAGQFGDLAESLLKRDADEKDSNAIPGVGGILDSVDSLLLSAPILYFYLLS